MGKCQSGPGGMKRYNNCHRDTGTGKWMYGGCEARRIRRPSQKQRACLDSRQKYLSYGLDVGCVVTAALYLPGPISNATLRLSWHETDVSGSRPDLLLAPVSVSDRLFEQSNGIGSTLTAVCCLRKKATQGSPHWVSPVSSAAASQPANIPGPRDSRPPFLAYISSTYDRPLARHTKPSM